MKLSNILAVWGEFADRIEQICKGETIETLHGTLTPTYS
ncbi:hypothetical protein NIES2104_04130 [Leptolyngbya sp. NIES-2104]|nr:hypothetical protein NIES2104_04130 [Leptolyngbya sp. NIES-2104]